ncbi:MAG TPA: metallopeptidase TldD-related protein [Candidatus Cloacimonas sp.]|nr:metallopeptidase TldD-related protein [Candidatus Cloacimonas sp.]HPS60427.1 metallopeptidase TldD-related protein [Candidatus Cloacimonas sp.]
MNSEKIVQYIQKHCIADDWTLNISKDDSHETRFAQNVITQHIAGAMKTISLSVAFGSKAGSCTVNQDDEESLAYIIKTAEDIAKLAPEDPEFVPSEGKKDIPKLANCDPETKTLVPEQMVEIVRKSVDRAKNIGATVSGLTEKHIETNALFTKNGFAGEYEKSDFGHSLTLKKDEVETKVAYEAKNFADFNLEELLEKLQNQAATLAVKQTFEPQKIAVLLRPLALQELFWFMGWMMDRRYADEGITPFTNQIGKPFFGEKFSWLSTYKQPTLLAPPFTSDGIIAEEIPWVENGILKNLYTSRYWAKKIGSKPGDNYNMFIPGEGYSEEEMLQMVPRGLIVNSFWYIRTVDMKAGEFTGTTRDGVWYFEDGKIKYAVNNLRFNEIPHEATKRIIATGNSELANPISLLPAMLIDGFNFVDKTSF